MPAAPSDDKAQAAIWADTLIRYSQDGYKPRRTIKMALTCGEDSAAPSTALKCCCAIHRALIDAGIVLNEGAGGQLDAAGQDRVVHTDARRRKDLGQLHPGSHQPRRPQLAAGARQRHLPSGTRHRPDQPL